MKENNNDKLFKNLADKYADIEGAELNRQAQSMNNVRNMNTKNMNTKKTSSWKVWVSVAAAAAVAVIITIVSSVASRNLLFNINRNTTNPKYDSTTGKEPIASAIQLYSDRFEIVDFEEDEGKFIYSVKDEKKDNSVITLEKSTLNDEGASYMKEGYAGGRKVFYKAEYEYNLIMFEYMDYVVIMTCRYEIDTLNELCEDLEINF